MDVDVAGREIIVYLDKPDIMTLFNGEYIHDVVKTSNAKDIHNELTMHDEVTIHRDFGKEELQEEENDEVFDNAMEALEELYLMLFAANQENTLDEIYDNTGVKVQKALNTYEHYREIQENYK